MLFETNLATGLRVTGVFRKKSEIKKAKFLKILVCSSPQEGMEEKRKWHRETSKEATVLRT